MLISTIVTIFLVTLTVGFHYEALYRLSLLLPRLNMPHRFRIVIGILGALFAHALEVWLFAFAYYVLVRTESFGSFVDTSGEQLNQLDECVYFSFVTYTTLGYGDVIATGPLRFLAGMESLTGLVLITWTASFLFIEMQQYWDQARQR